MPSSSKSDKHNKHRAPGERAKKLAGYIAKGKHAKASRLLDKHPSPPLVREQLEGGETVLHVAARSRGVEPALLEMLVARGGDMNAADARGRRPLHAAASASSVRALLGAAERHGQTVDLGACDDAGLSVDDAVWLTLREEEEAEQDSDGAGEEWRQRVAAAHRGEQEGPSAADDEAAWRAKLRDEAQFEAGFGGGGGFDDWGGGEAEETGDWFDEVAAQVAARAAARAREARERAEAEAARREEERSRWQRAAREASEAREREYEERAREARQRAAQAAAAETAAHARAAYVAAWAALGARAASAEPVRLAELPWPCARAPAADAPVSAAEVKARVLTEEMATPAARRRALQDELRRWHPDKFVARWGGRLLAAEREVVLAGVTQVSQCLTELLSAGG